MSQTLPQIDEGLSRFETGVPAEASAVSENLQDKGVRTNHFLGSSPWVDATGIPEPPVVELVIPVYNEETVLESSVGRLRAYLDESFPFSTTIRIVDNASTDGTWDIATRLAATVPGVSAMHLNRKGRGYALRSAWSSSTAEIVAYMDVDLSTDLGGFLPLIAPLLSGYGDVAIGSRLAKGARVVRGPKRELISRAYNLLLRLSLPGRFSDAQCGFKALRRESALDLLPLVQDEQWFFDTELLVAAERRGMRICEVPVDWVDDPDSRVQIWRTALADLRGVWRISHGRSRHVGRESVTASESSEGQVVADPLLRFAGVGAISTLGYLVLLVAWRQITGIYAANALALALCGLFNLALHKQLARNLTTPSHAQRFAGVAVGLFAISLSLTSAALLAAHTLSSGSLSLSIVAVTTANAVAAVLRFAVLRAWIFRPYDAFSRSRDA